MKISTIFCTCLFCFCLQYNYCAARDTITATTPLMSATRENISSARNKFQLGFFTPNGGENLYIGIWYSMDTSTVVWVANRHQAPTAGIFSLEKDGNLKVLDSSRTSNYFTTNLTSLGPSQPFTRTARLLDSGNLVLIDDQTGKTLWQSFDNPTDTFLPGMKMDENLTLISWTTSENPANGKFRFQKDQERDNGYVILKSFQQDQEGTTVQRTREYWKSGGDSASSFNPNKMYEYAVHLLSGLDGFNNSRLIMDYSGVIKYLSWDAYRKAWDRKWSGPKGKCDPYNICGDFGSCNLTDSSYSCNCLPGFEPSSPDYWKSRDFVLSGCIRKSNICNKQPENDEFLNLKAIKVGNPNLPSFKAESEQACRVKCLDNCQCQAYLYMNDSLRGDRDRRHLCWIWTVNVTDIQEGNIHNASYNLFIRKAGGIFVYVSHISL